MWLFVGLGNPRGKVEGPSNLPLSVAVLPENVFQEHEHRIEPVLITLSSPLVYQWGKYGMLVGWVVMRGRFMVLFMDGGGKR
jgi:hypothetical protein